MSYTRLKLDLITRATSSTWSLLEYCPTGTAARLGRQKEANSGLRFLLCYLFRHQQSSAQCQESIKVGDIEARGMQNAKYYARLSFVPLLPSCDNQ